MIFLWGGGRKSKNPDEAFVPYACQRCNSLQNFAVLENYRYGHLYGIRIAKWDTNRWLECLECNYSLSIPDSDGFNAAKEISNRWKPQLSGDLEMPQVFNLCGQVAQLVLKDMESAKLFYGLGGEVVVSDTKPLEIPSEPLELEKLCAKCDERRDGDGNFCAICGEELVLFAAEPYFAPGFTNYCDRCAEPRADEGSFCHECGAKLDS